MKYYVTAVLLLLTTGIMAQPDRAEVRRGNQAFGREKFTTAELEYRRALEKDSSSFTAHYNLSNAKYKQEQYEQAENELKTRIDSLSHPLHRADAYHNLGNAQLMQKKYAESIDSYKQSLRLRPHDMETKSNLAYAQKMLQNQDQGGDQQDQDDQNDQDQNDQDQNQQDQNQDTQEQNQDQKEQEVPPKITPQSALQMLEAMQQKEKETQEKVNNEKAKALKRPPTGKYW